MPPSGRIVRIRLLQFPPGPGVELFQTEHASHEPPERIADYGLQHLALYTDDIQAAAKRLEMAGGTLLSGPHPLAGIDSGQGNCGLYARTPWGMLIELIAYPAGIQ
ncbi:catechol 2,3-dioxygenase-like lactoylglutathione lyase family enzyme [Paenibacillus forsythiae]|uniref:Catechol 2,3-dioxygenase-like lactoylglutathione lyase family enzyme n=1 Tax=Paenibacillus forsythiae TaxID=365616 RepID=A0ABU3H845_9BACL|nr:VOC family protein [Paenibacillus forsythiae]MDT3426998.1 catechol 2,3-dioxygenase-like lactoylglutathione lyase family enzyme [Paenibacillus forsythiae]